MFVTFIVYLTTCSANCIGFLECHLSPGAPHLFHNDRDLFEMNDELLGYRSFSLCVVCAVSYFPIFLYYNIFITRKKGYFFFFPKRLISVFTHWFSFRHYNISDFVCFGVFNYIWPVFFFKNTFETLFWLVSINQGLCLC